MFAAESHQFSLIQRDITSRLVFGNLKSRRTLTLSEDRRTATLKIDNDSEGLLLSNIDDFDLLFFTAKSIPHCKGFKVLQEQQSVFKEGRLVHGHTGESIAYLNPKVGMARHYHCHGFVLQNTMDHCMECDSIVKILYKKRSIKRKSMSVSI